MSPQAYSLDENCAFCKVVLKDDGFRVFEDEHTIAFLDHRPLFPGHCLLIPKGHFETIEDLPDNVLAPLFANVRTLCTAVQSAMRAEGTFVAANNRVSQSVPHFHVHIVPRKKGDGLKGFFWPRGKYKTTEEIKLVVSDLRAAIARLNTRQSV
jgi:histidine triad (HIT) family protein